MPHYVGAEAFDALQEAAGPLIEKARQFAQGEGEEAQIMTLAFQAVAYEMQVPVQALIVALGATVGTILAQVHQPSEMHAVFKAQCARSIADVAEAARPKGNA